MGQKFFFTKSCIVSTLGFETMKPWSQLLNSAIIALKWPKINV